MERINNIWKQHVDQNPIENVLLEIYLANQTGKNCYSYELSGPKFNEILADLSLLKIWQEWKSGFSTKYFLNDIVMIVDEDCTQRVSINKTIYQEYLQLNNSVEPASGSRFLQDLPYITDIRIHKDDRIEQSQNERINDEKVYSNLHVKCCRKIPLSITQFPPYNSYNAIEKLAFRYYRNTNFTVNFIISRPCDCLRTFDELLVNWQNSRFMIKISVITPCPELEAIIKYLGFN